MMTVTQLARACGFSRGTLLYYESIGLLARPPRTAGNYRAYTNKDLERLRRIRALRGVGVKLEDIRSVLDRPLHDAAGVLERRLVEIGAQIETLRGHQRAILQLLRGKASLRRKEVITKEKWVSIMKAAGFSEADMHRWHAEFEHSAPDEHQEFLEFLRIPPEEAREIRDWSRKAAESRS